MNWPSGENIHKNRNSGYLILWVSTLNKVICVMKAWRLGSAGEHMSQRQLCVRLTKVCPALLSGDVGRSHLGPPWRDKEETFYFPAAKVYPMNWWRVLSQSFLRDGQFCLWEKASVGFQNPRSRIWVYFDTWVTRAPLSTFSLHHILLPV